MQRNTEFVQGSTHDDGTMEHNQVQFYIRRESMFKQRLLGEDLKSTLGGDTELKQAFSNLLFQ